MEVVSVPSTFPTVRGASRLHILPTAWLGVAQNGVNGGSTASGDLRGLSCLAGSANRRIASMHDNINARALVHRFFIARESTPTTALRYKHDIF